ncbi:MAG: hypothetical protein QM731_16990 [Chitinophagaceae bacterium]
MKYFLNKYGFRIVVFFLLALLLAYYIPHSTNRYMKEELDMIKRRTNYILVYTFLFLYAVVLTICFMRFKKSKQRLTVIGKLLILSIPLWFILHAVFLTALFFANQLNTKTIIDKVYVAERPAGTGILLLNDIARNKLHEPAAFHFPDNLPGINDGDTITISFKNGWLDYCFDPHLKK